MSTAAVSGVYRPSSTERSGNALLSLSLANPASAKADLTTHRITKTHHGRTLLTLGHAAEYLADSRRYSIQEMGNDSDIEAIHILMGLSREVFEDFAKGNTPNRLVGDWAIERVVRVFE